MKSFMRGHKQDYFIIIIAGILLVIIFGIVFISFTTKPPSQTTNTPSIQKPTIAQSDNLPILYDNAAEDRLAQKINNRPTLVPADQQQKSDTLTTILHGLNSGVLYETDDVRVEYVQSADIFMAEIKTQNLIKAKADANTWFLHQGFSQAGICNLPLMFYLDPQVSDALQGENVIFSPLPPSC